VGAYSAPPDPLAVFRGAYFLREGRESGGSGEEDRRREMRGGSTFVLCPRKKKGKSAPMLNAAPPTHGRTRFTVDSADTGSESADR